MSDVFEWTPARTARLRHLWALGKTRNQIATDLETTASIVSTKVSRLKLPRRPEPALLRFTTEQEAKVAELLRGGMRKYQIGRELGFKEATFRRMCDASRSVTQAKPDAPVVEHPKPDHRRPPMKAGEGWSIINRGLLTLDGTVYPG